MMPKLRNVAHTPVFERFSAGNDSLKRIHPMPSKMPMNSRIIKIPCQPTLPVSKPPMTGAATGATPLIAPITANILASSFPENLSVATEREITIPPAPAIPCINHKVTNE